MRTVTEKLQKVNRVKLLSAVATIVTVLVFALLWEPIYETNDDTVIAQILSGTFSGAPDAHTVYVLYPYSLFVGLLYRIVPGIPWHGMILYGLLVYSLYVIINSMAEYLRDIYGFRRDQIITGEIAFGLLVVALNADHLVIVQYSYVTAVIVCGALCSFLLGEKHYARGIILYTMAFCLRKEVALMSLPFFCIGIFGKWISTLSYARYEKDSKIVTATEAKKIGKALGILSLCFLVSFGIHKTAYIGGDWKNYELGHDARTVIYDYGGVSVDYESNRGWYEDLGISEGEYRLLDYCDYSLSDTWDGETMHLQADWIKEQWNYRYTILYLKNRILLAKDTLIPDGITDFSILFWILMIGLTIRILLRRRFWDLLVPAGILAAHMVCWTYLYWSIRMPERITDGLWLYEILMLSVLFVMTCYSDKEKNEGLRIIKQGTYGVMILLCSVCSTVLLVSSVKCLDEEYQTKLRNYELWQKLLEEAAGEKDLYILDTYSFSNYTSKVFREDTSEAAGKLVLAGSWMDGSPLYKEKLLKYTGQDTLQKALESGAEASFMVAPALAFHVDDGYLASKYPNLEIVMYENR